MPARKRAHEEMEEEEVVEELSTLQKLRNMWQFANLAQYISLFGEAVKIDKDFDIEVCALCAGHSGRPAHAESYGVRANIDAGTGERVPEATGVRKTCADRAGLIEACVVAQGLNV